MVYLHRNGTETGNGINEFLRSVQKCSLVRPLSEDPLFPIVSVPFPVLPLVPVSCSVNKPLKVSFLLVFSNQESSIING